MKTNRAKLLTFLIAVTLVMGMWSAFGVSKAEAIIIICKSPVFGITRGETARAYLLNTGGENEIIVNYKFLDMAGNIVAQSGDMRVAPGQSGFFDLDASTLDFQGALRFPLRVEISIGDPELKSRQPAHIHSLEVFDTGTGETSFIDPWL
jgi:hypothetical protein